jgi:hypothetical protein
VWDACGCDRSLWLRTGPFRGPGALDPGSRPMISREDSSVLAAWDHIHLLSISELPGLAFA